MEKRNLKEIISSNESIQKAMRQSPFLKSNLIGMLKNIEINIPEECRDNLYNNLETVEILCDSYCMSCSADFNAVGIDYRLIWLADNNVVGENVGAFSDVLALSLYHELLHLASSTNIVENDRTKGYAGFQNTYINENGQVTYGEVDALNGLSEGFTQYLALKALDLNIEQDTSNYAVQINAAQKLVDVVGIDVVKKAYFDNRNGMEEIKKVLESKNMSPEWYEQLEAECHVGFIYVDLKTKLNSPEDIARYNMQAEMNNDAEIKKVAEQDKEEI